MADDLTLGQKVPNKSERDAAGAIAARIVRGTPEFAKLVEYDKGNVVFKDEEGTGADRMMSPRLRDAMAKLAKSVAAEFTGVKLRVTEAWDENGEHASGSLHYEGRAADLTTSDRDAGKLGRLGRLAVEAGFDWVFYEDSSHVHVAARKEGSGTPMEALAAEDTGGGWVARRFEPEIGALLAAMEEERASISIVGRALTDEESVQLTRIQRALPLLEEAHEIFTGAAPSGGGGSHLHAPAPPAGEGEEEDPPAEHALAAPESDSPAVAAALAALSPRVTARSHPDALRIAFQAYHNFRAARPGELRNPYLYYVDYGLDNRTQRGYVFDMDALTVVDGPFCVAHGRGSSAVRDAVPTVFSDRPGSAATSLGLYVTRETYEFHGKYGGGKKYRSVGLRLSGESGPFNHNALARGVVAHGAPYVTDRDAGRSEGCPAMADPRARRLLPMLARGGAVFHFSPRDQGWLSGDPWISPR